MCRAFLILDLEISAALASKINQKPRKKKPKKIEMMFHTTTKQAKIFDVTMQNTEENFEFKTQLNKLEKDTVLYLPNPNYQAFISHLPHLNEIKLNNTVKEKELMVHVILGVSDYAKIKMLQRSRIEQPGDPIAELTRFGWFIISLTHESMKQTQLGKSDHPVLTNNKNSTLGKLNNLLKHLKKNTEKFIVYDHVIQK